MADVKKPSIASSVSYKIGGKEYSAKDVSQFKSSQIGNVKTGTDIAHESAGKVQSQTSDFYKKDSGVPFPVSWTVKMKKKQKETQDILSYHSQAAGCSDKARAKASGGRQPIEECGRTGL